MANVSYIGAVIAVSASTPATVDAAGFAALTWTTLGEVVELGEIGDSSGDITVTHLSGRTVHINGAKDGGEVSFTFTYGDADAGQVILRNNANGSTTVSFKITDADGEVAYFHGVVANVRDMARTAEAYKGMTGVVRVNSATVRA